MRVTIKFVNWPKTEGAKNGNLKTEDGQTLMCPVGLLEKFERGATVEVPTRPGVWGSGADARNVTLVTGEPQVIGINRASVAVGNYTPEYGQGPQGPYEPLGEVPYPQHMTVQPKPENAPAPFLGPSRGNPEARNIFVCGVVQQAMSTGKFTASEIRVLTEAANEAFELIRPLPPPPHE